MCQHDKLSTLSSALNVKVNEYGKTEFDMHFSEKCSDMYAQTVVIGCLAEKTSSYKTFVFHPTLKKELFFSAVFHAF